MQVPARGTRSADTARWGPQSFPKSGKVSLLVPSQGGGLAQPLTRGHSREGPSASGKTVAAHESHSSTRLLREPLWAGGLWSVPHGRAAHTQRSRPQSCGHAHSWQPLGDSHPASAPRASARLSTHPCLHTGRNSRARGTSKGPTRPTAVLGGPVGQRPPPPARAELIPGTEVACVPPEEPVPGPARLSAREEAHGQVPTAGTVHQHELDEGQELPAGGCPMATRELGPWRTCSRGLHGCPPGRDRVTLGKLYPRPEQTRASTLFPPGMATARAGASTHTPAGPVFPGWSGPHLPLPCGARHPPPGMWGSHLSLCPPWDSGSRARAV